MTALVLDLLVDRVAYYKYSLAERRGILGPQFGSNGSSVLTAVFQIIMLITS